MKGLYYKLGYRFLAEGDADKGASGADEKGWAATVGYVFHPMERVSLDTLAEYTDIRNFEGVSGEDRRYFSTSTSATLDAAWNLTVGYTAHNIDGADDQNDHLLQISAGYDFRKET